MNAHAKAIGILMNDELISRNTRQIIYSFAQEYPSAFVRIVEKVTTPKPTQDPHEKVILDLLRSGTGQTIPAIKMYRELTGTGLFEAKNYVEKLKDTYRIVT